MRIRILALLCASVLLGPAQAREAAAEPTHPTMQDLLKWKSDVLSKYEDITYLDENSRKVSEDVFFARILAERRGFSMQTDARAPKQITIRLLSDTEQRATQAGMK